MLHMDIDIRPASLRSMFQGSMKSAKRPRSPDSLNSGHDRPLVGFTNTIPYLWLNPVHQKRLLIGNNEEAMDSADFSDSSFGVVASSSHSRFPSEDWVREARGLSINNRTPYESRSINSSFENLGGSLGDIDMVCEVLLAQA